MTVKKVTKPKKKKLIARVKCKGDLCNTNHKVISKEITDCDKAAKMRSEDDKSCSYGCLGYGTCAEKCPFDAIEMIDGLAVVIEDKCKGCRICVKACPNDVIEMVPAEQEVFVDCNSKDIGKVAREACKVSCIGCQMCVKVCPFFAMDFTDKLAHINYDNCTNCRLCADKCPTKAITGESETRGKAEISEEKCIGCTVCAQICPVAAIEGNREEVHKVDPEICIGCTICAKVCPVSAIDMIEDIKIIDSYEKEIIKQFSNFDDLKNLDEEIKYKEEYDSVNYEGLLSLSKISKLEHTNNFEVIYKGQLNSPAR